VISSLEVFFRVKQRSRSSLARALVQGDDGDRRGRAAGVPVLRNAIHPRLRHAAGARLPSTSCFLGTGSNAENVLTVLFGLAC
jgi:hypothetical protein